MSWSAGYEAGKPCDCILPLLGYLLAVILVEAGGIAVGKYDIAGRVLLFTGLVFVVEDFTKGDLVVFLVVVTTLQESLNPLAATEPSEWKSMLTWFVLLLNDIGLAVPQVLPSNTLPSPSLTDI